MLDHKEKYATKPLNADEALNVFLYTPPQVLNMRQTFPRNQCNQLGVAGVVDFDRREEVEYA